MKAAWRRAAVGLVIFGASAVAACTVDPSEGLTVFTLRNDLGFGVTLTACDDAECHSLPSTVNDHLAPDQGLPVNVSIDGVVTYYRILADSGGRPRCLGVVAHGTEKKTLLLSSSHACGS